MNERTQELIKQFATDLLNRSGYDMREYEPFLEEAEKFAEMLIRECAKHAEHAKGTDVEFETYFKAMIFGVEEPQGWVCPTCGTDRTQSACPRGHTAALTGDCPMYGVAQ